MQKKISFRWLFLAGFALASVAGAASCPAATPEAAAQQWIRAQQGSELFHAAALTTDLSLGYRVERVMSDAGLHAQWALVSDCAHPARPWLAVRISLPAAFHAHPVAVSMNTSQRAFPDQISAMLPAYIPISVSSASPAVASFAVSRAVSPSTVTSPMLVHAGDHVVLWNQEPELHLAIAAISLDYGHAGQVVHLRRDTPNTMQSVTITGIVRGPGSVELMP